MNSFVLPDILNECLAGGYLNRYSLTLHSCSQIALDLIFPFINSNITFLGLGCAKIEVWGCHAALFCRKFC